LDKSKAAHCSWISDMIENDEEKGSKITPFRLNVRQFGITIGKTVFSCKKNPKKKRVLKDFIAELYEVEYCMRGIKILTVLAKMSLDIIET